MAARVKIDDLTDALELVADEQSAWLDRETGRTVIIEDHIMRLIEENGDVGELADWEQTLVPAARGIAAGDARYLALPTKFDFHEYRHMERFIGTVADPAAADQLWRAIKGHGAFRHFKDTADRLGLIDDWFRHRDQAAKRFMLDWAEANAVEVDESPGRAGFA